MKATFLAVEPDSATRLSLEEVFTGSKFSFPKVDPTAVLEQVSREHPDLIMLDIDLPDMKSYEIAARLQMNLATSRVPVVFVSRDGRPGSSSPEMEGVLKTSETKILKQRVEELVRQSRMERSVSQAVTEATGALGDCSADFTQSELEALKKAGFEVDAEMNLGPLTKHAARYQALLGSSLSVRQAAARMGVTNGRVRQKLRNPPTLLGVRIGNAWRLPAFQFDAMESDSGSLTHFGPDNIRKRMNFEPVTDEPEEETDEEKEDEASS